MKKLLLPILCFPFLAACIVTAEEHKDWGYSGAAGPEHWGEISNEFATCSTGKNQSPVNIVDTADAKLPSIAFKYGVSGKSIANNGHTIQVNFEDSGRIVLNDHAYKLLQVHFHAPSENKISNKSYPLEAHYVHSDEKGNLAVVAVLFEQGKKNKALQKIWSAMPHKAKRTRHFTNFSAMDLLPKNKSYYRFNGSLTTPPCSEGVLWLVMKKPVSISKAQVSAFKKLWHHGNNRPVQPINSRLIVK